MVASDNRTYTTKELADLAGGSCCAAGKTFAGFGFHLESRGPPALPDQVFCQ